jgi:hypothetical protein
MGWLYGGPERGRTRLHCASTLCTADLKVQCALPWRTQSQAADHEICPDGARLRRFLSVVRRRSLGSSRIPRWATSWGTPLRTASGSWSSLETRNWSRAASTSRIWPRPRRWALARNSRLCHARKQSTAGKLQALGSSLQNVPRLVDLGLAVAPHCAEPRLGAFSLCNTILYAAGRCAKGGPCGGAEAAAGGRGGSGHCGSRAEGPRPIDR